MKTPENKNTQCENPKCTCTDCKCDPCECNGSSCCGKKETCSSSWCTWGAAVRILITVLLVVGAFVVGLSLGGHDRYDGRSSRYEHGMDGRWSDGPNQYAMKMNCPMMEQSQSMSHDMMDMSMRDMGKMLEGKTGSELNRAFLEGMIPHHQGAVEMAKYLENSDKPELRQMGQDIITAQTKEIEQMKQWMLDWGYTQTGVTNSGTMMQGMHMMPDGTMMHN